MNVDNVFEQAWLCIYVYVHYVLFWLGMEHVRVYMILNGKCKEKYAGRKEKVYESFATAIKSFIV